MTPLEDAHATISAMSATLAKYRERYGPLDTEPDDRYRHAEGLSPLLAAMHGDDTCCDCMGSLEHTAPPRRPQDVPEAMGAVSTGWSWWRWLGRAW